MSTNNNSATYSKISSIFDENTFTEIDKFAKGSEGDVEVITGFGLINGVQVFAFAQNPEVNLGAITVSQCEKILKVYELAEKTGTPVVGIFNSNGMKLSEGFEVLNAYGSLIKKVTSLSGVLPQIAVVDGPALGTSALIVGLFDIVIALESSELNITVPSEVSVDEIAEKGGVDFKLSSFEEVVDTIAKLVYVLPSNNLSDMYYGEYETSSVDVNVDVASNILDLNSSIELKKNTTSNVNTYLGTISGLASGVIQFNGEKISPIDAKKAEAFIKLCDAYNLPIVTIADSSGLDNESEICTFKSCVALASTYSTTTTPKISLITKESIGTAYLLLAGKGSNADITIAWEDAIASPLNVEASVAFLYGQRLADGESREALEDEYKKTIGSSYTAAACGAVDDVISPEDTRNTIVKYLDVISTKRELTAPRKHTVK